MKKTLKALIFSVVLALAFCAFSVAGYAEGEEELVPAFSVRDKDGNLKEITGYTFEELRTAIPSLEDGDTVIINRNIEASRQLYFESTEEAPRTINIDLNGKKIYTSTKITPALISTGDYTTLNVYSSVKGAVLYCANLVESSTSGNVFNVRGDYSVMNVGDFTSGDVTYPGSNISTYSACLIDIVVDNVGIKNCDENCRFNVNGGNYYSIHTDYSGYIIPRGGKIVMNFNNANIISMETKAPINSAGSETVLNMTGCVFMHYKADALNLFNNAFGTINMTDCITSYRVASASAGMGVGVLNLFGKNVFSAQSEGDYMMDLIGNNEGLVSVTTYSDVELTQGLAAFEYFDNSINFNPLTAEVPKLKSPATLVPSEDAVKYQFVMGTNKISQTWMKSEEPIRPFELPIGGEEGVYKYGWKKEINDNGVIVYTVGLVADYSLKVRAVYENDELYFKLYAPAEIIDNGYIDYVNVLIQGENFGKKDWSEEEIDGVKYCYAVTGIIYPENANDEISVRIPCDYGKGVYVDTTWTFTVGEYINAVLETEADNVYTEDQYKVIHDIAENYISVNEETESE